MHFAPSNIVDGVAMAYMAEWRRRHPATDPPALGPVPSAAELADPLWVEARQIWDAEVARRRTVTPTTSAPAWGAYAGGMVCPNKHSVRLGSEFCQTCGLRVPSIIAGQARDLTEQLNIKVGIGLMRMDI